MSPALRLYRESHTYSRIHSPSIIAMLKAHIPLKTALALAAQRKLNGHKQHEMYMPNARILHLEPKATYVPVTRIEVLHWVTYILSVFRYQHVGKGTAKLWRLGSKPTPVPDANNFASQWNMGFMPSISSEVLRFKACGRHLTSFKVKSQYFASLKLQLKTCLTQGSRLT